MNQIAFGFQEQRTLHGHRRSKRPARAANRLILNRRDGAEQSPVQVVGQIVQHGLGQWMREHAAAIRRARRPEASQRPNLVVRLVGQMVDAEREAQVGAVLRVDEAQVLHENVATMHGLLGRGVDDAVLLDETHVLRVDVRVAGRVHELFHWIEGGKVAGARETDARLV